MNYEQIGNKVRMIRETELKKSREEFAEELGISIDTVNRLETAKSEVRNVEIFIKISELTGYTLEELLLNKNINNKSEKVIQKINYVLNILSDDELEYVYNNINQFVKFVHRNELKTLKDIKKEIKKREIN